MRDPVRPVIVKSGPIGWDAGKRDVELRIECAFKGDELVLRIGGWVTVDVKKVIKIGRRCGFLKGLDFGLDTGPISHRFLWFRLCVSKKLLSF